MKWVDDAHELREASEALLGAEVLYLDTEFDAGREGTELCLIQLSGGGEAYLIDALRLPDLSPLRAPLEAPGRTWVLHAGQQDVALLSARVGAKPPRVFDTQIGWGLLSVEHSTSLAYLKYRVLGLRGEKAHQSDDWRRRPLPAPQLAYAADDVAHLPALYAALLARCTRRGREGIVYEASADSLKPNIEPPQPLRLDAFRNAWQLETEGQAVLRALIDWFNALPESDKEAAPDLKGLFAIASRRPKSVEELGALRAVPRRSVSRFGKALLQASQNAVARSGSGFVPIEPPPYAVPADILAAGWLEAARAEVCTELELAPELVLPARVMRRLREAAAAAGSMQAALGALSGWRHDLLAGPLSKKFEHYGPLFSDAREVD